MIYVVAIHDSRMTNEEYQAALKVKYSFLLTESFKLHVYTIDQVEDLPLDGSSYRHVYFDTDSIGRSDERVLNALIKFNSARQIWISLKNQAKASTNPDIKGKKNRTFTSGVTKSLWIEE